MRSYLAFTMIYYLIRGTELLESDVSDNLYWPPPTRTPTVSETIIKQQVFWIIAY